MKTKTYDFRAFVKREHLSNINTPTLSLIPLATASLIPMKVFAEESIKVKMMTAFTPIIELIQGMAYPIAMVVVLGGALMLVVGNKEKGFSMMQSAGMGYVIVMIAPMILNVLVDAVGGIAS